MADNMSTAFQDELDKLIEAQLSNAHKLKDFHIQVCLKETLLNKKIQDFDKENNETLVKYDALLGKAVNWELDLKETQTKVEALEEENVALKDRVLELEKILELERKKAKLEREKLLLVESSTKDWVDMATKIMSWNNMISSPSSDEGSAVPAPLTISLTKKRKNGSISDSLNKKRKVK